MTKLEALTPDIALRGIEPDTTVTVVSAKWFGTDAVELTYKRQDGRVANVVLYRDSEASLEIAEQGRPWDFDADGALFRLVAEANRIRLAHLFDPLLAVHTSLVDPLPHQITAVYESMLPRQPLRFLLADDPGAGKTIMAGLYIRELIVRGDLRRCLVICPGSLAEQWQDELNRKFNLPFDILTNDKLESARTGNWFLESDLVIARLDKLSRDEDVQAKLTAPDCRYDLIIFDEAHKLAATYFGAEAKYTKRYRLAQRLSGITRHLLLMTATPHNGKDADFQLFLALLDNDRFEGRPRGDVPAATNASDLMRRMVKEKLVKFDGTPLFPPRIAYTVPYKLSPPEARLYDEVTQYVREEFNRAEKLNNDKRAGTIGFALTILQRRLASSPEAIYQSLRRRRERLEKRRVEVAAMRQGTGTLSALDATDLLDPEELEDLEDAPENEADEREAEILDEATAARTIEELQAEIAALRRLEAMALDVRNSRQDAKWIQLAGLLQELLSVPASPGRVREEALYGAGELPPPRPSPKQKLVLFTEQRDTLSYLRDRISTLLGKADAIRIVHGGMHRDDRREAQEAFLNDPLVQVLIATDAAGEGVNLQRAHLMVNYDLPWNPNRLEQRFGRIHRIGQTEICYLWNLLAEGTREGDVYRLLLTKLEEARKALGGQVFDVLGKLQFEGKPLRDLLLQAIRHGQDPEVLAKLTEVVEHAVDRDHLRELLEERSLAHESFDALRLGRVRDEMDRADARRLQPHYIESFFREAFTRLDGTMRQREPRRFEVTHVPAALRNRHRALGAGDPLLARYERIVFQKDLISPPNQPLAAFVCPGHPLLDAALDTTLERHRDLLRRGSILVDESDAGSSPRVLFFLEHAVRDAGQGVGGEPRVVSRQMLYIERAGDGGTRHLHYAPYLDYRPLATTEPDARAILARPECAWINSGLEHDAQTHAIATVVPEHLREVRDRRVEWVRRTRAAVQERLSHEINHWDHRAAQLQLDEAAGKANARLNSAEARRRADELQARLHRRLAELDNEAQVAPLPPVILGGVVVVPGGLLRSMAGAGAITQPPIDTEASAARARAAVMAAERELGFEPIDRELEKLGYDIESRDARSGRLRFIEVKGRVAEAPTITVTRNEILYSLNKPDDFILAIVIYHADGSERIHYVRRPFTKEPDFELTSSDYKVAELLLRASGPS